MINLTRVVQEPYCIVGSTVLNLRYAKDIDIVCAKDDILISTTGDEYIQSAVVNGRTIEFLLTDSQNSLKKILNYYYFAELIDTTDVCYILKAGHIHIGRNQQNWEKHIMDYHILRERVFNPNDKLVLDLIKEHKKTTDERIKQRTPKLKGVSKEEFFDDYVEKYFIHDDIHQLVAHKAKPMYSYMQKNELVECHQDLWNNFSYQEKLQTVLEEAYVIALERHVIPARMAGTVEISKPPYLAFKWALYRICTTLCSGWFRQFAIDNYFTILNQYDERKITNTLKTLLETKNGKTS